MNTGSDRILTTHVGSLPRNAVLTDLLIRRESGDEIDPAQLAAEMDRAVAAVVERQLETGIDIGNDGEQQRVGFQTYIPQRMSGFGGESKRNHPMDYIDFPRFSETLPMRFPKRGPQLQRAAGRRRAAVSRRRRHQGGDRPLQGGPGPWIRGVVHDGPLAGNRGDDHAECPL